MPDGSQTELAGDAPGRGSEAAFWLLASAGALAALAHALWIGPVCDDAGISLAYARNLAAGEGLRLTPLSPRVEAYSNPLWVLWLAAGFAARLARGDGASFAGAVGAAAAAAAALVAGLVPSRARGRAPLPLDSLATWLLALDTTYATWAASGLESGAFALALAVALVLLAGETRSGRGLGSAVPFGLLAVLRPEGPLYAAAAWPLRAFGAHRRGRWRPEIAWLALAAAPAAAWLVFRLLYYGRWVPNTYTAKSAWDFGGVRYLRAWLAAGPWTHGAMLLAPAALAARGTRRAASLVLPPLASAAAFVLWAGGDWMEEHRFVAHALPAAALLAALAPPALAEIAGRTGRMLAWRWPVGAERALAFALSVGLAAAAAGEARSRSALRRAHPVFPLDYMAEQARWYRAQADRLGLTRPRVAHFDVGAMALLAGAEVVDLGGLADLRLARTSWRDPVAAREYVFGEVRPEMLNVHGPCEYLRADARLRSDYSLLPGGKGGGNYARRALLAGEDDRCPGGLAAVRDLVVGGPEALAAALHRAVESGEPARARDLWLCARAHFSEDRLPGPEAEWLGARLEALGLAEPDTVRARVLLSAALALRPVSVAAALRLEALTPVRQAPR